MGLLKLGGVAIVLFFVFYVAQVLVAKTVLTGLALL